MKGSEILYLLLFIFLLIAFFYFRKPIKKVAEMAEKSAEIASKNVEQWCEEQREKLNKKDDEIRARLLKVMKKFVEDNNDKYILSPVILYERSNYNQKTNRYYQYRNDKEKLKKIFEEEDQNLIAEHKDKVERIKNIIEIIETTGEWPVKPVDIYHIMRGPGE